ncbi:MAG TPA: hypothetical protein VIX37_00950 [Candidatus Sulfotelmatobacter sp.]
MLHSIVKASIVAALIAVAAALWAQEQQLQIIPGGQNPPPVGFKDDLPPGAMRGKATTCCLECHEARIILQQRLNKAAWTKEVDKMIKWGAVVEASDRDALIDYLSTNFSPDQPPYEPLRTTSDKASGKNGGKKNPK